MIICVNIKTQIGEFPSDKEVRKVKARPMTSLERNFADQPELMECEANCGLSGQKVYNDFNMKMKSSPP